MASFWTARLLSAFAVVKAVYSAAPPTCDGISATRRTVGYYDTYFAGTPCGTFPESLTVAGYTHINAAYAWIDPDNYTVTTASAQNPEIWTRLVSLKETNPGLQVWISIGGWMMNSPIQPTSETFEELVSGEGKDDRQANFFESLIAMLQEYGFDGVDIDWLSTRHDAYTDFLSALRLELDATGFTYGLSITTPRYSAQLREYDIPRIQHTVDWFNVMTYDINDYPLESNTVTAHSNLTEFDDALSELWQYDVDPAKVTLGLAYYGRSYTLKSTSCNDPGCASLGFGPSGVCYDTPGYLEFGQIQDAIAEDGTLTYYDRDAAIKIATYGDDQWISYDDQDTFAQKVDYANEHCIGGTNVWSIDLDKNGTVIAALSESTGQLERSAAEPPDPGDSMSECQWTECIQPQSQTCSARGLGGPSQESQCQEGCPSGTTSSWVASGKGVCTGGYRQFCCPNSGRPDKCDIRKDHQRFSERCSGRCSGSEVKIGTDTTDCLTGWNDICCTRTEAVSSLQQCSWTTSCSPAPKCPSNKLNLIATSADGDGPLDANASCKGTDTRALCCSEPNPFTNCGWEKGDSPGSSCSAGCSDYKTIVASKTSDCVSGAQALCCNRTPSNSTLAYYGALLETFTKEPNCPKLLDPDPDFSYDQSVDSDEDSSLIPRDVDVLQARATEFDSISDLTIFGSAFAAMGSISYQALQLQETFDDFAGSKYMKSEGYTDMFERYPDEDPMDLFEQYLCKADNALVDYENKVKSDQRCVLPWSGEEPTGDLDKRRLSEELGRTRPRTGRDPRINTGAVITRIMDDTTDIPFLYARLFQYQEGTEAILEVAYDLINVPDLREQPDDRLYVKPITTVVFHFHISSMLPRDDTGTLYPAVPVAHMYHAQWVYNPNPNGPSPEREWRVEYGRGGRSARHQPNGRANIFRCEDHNGLAWYPADPQRTGPADILDRLGDRLWEQNIFTTDTLSNWASGAGDAHWVWDEHRPALRNDRENTGGSYGDPVDMRPDVAPNNFIRAPPSGNGRGGRDGARGQGRGRGTSDRGRTGQNRGGGGRGRGGSGRGGNRGG